MSKDPEDDLAFSLDLRGLKVALVLDEGDPVLTLSDGSQAIAVEPGAGGTTLDAIAGAERLAERAAQLVAILRVRSGDPTPIRNFHRPESEIKWWLPAEADATPEPAAEPAPEAEPGTELEIAAEKFRTTEERLKSEVEKARAERDDAIVHAVKAGMRQNRIMEITGYSREFVRQVVREAEDRAGS